MARSIPIGSAGRKEPSARRRRARTAARQSPTQQQAQLGPHRSRSCIERKALGLWDSRRLWSPTSKHLCPHQPREPAKDRHRSPSRLILRSSWCSCRHLRCRWSGTTALGHPCSPHRWSRLSMCQPQTPRWLKARVRHRSVRIRWRQHLSPGHQRARSQPTATKVPGHWYLRCRSCQSQRQRIQQRILMHSPARGPRRMARRQSLSSARGARRCQTSRAWGLSRQEVCRLRKASRCQGELSRVRRRSTTPAPRLRASLAVRGAQSARAKQLVRACVRGGRGVLWCFADSLDLSSEDLSEKGSPLSWGLP